MWGDAGSVAGFRLVFIVMVALVERTGNVQATLAAFGEVQALDLRAVRRMTEYGARAHGLG